MGLKISTCITYSSYYKKYKSYIKVDWTDADSDKPGHAFDGFKIHTRMENHDDYVKTKTCYVTDTINRSGTKGVVSCSLGYYSSPWSSSYFLTTDGWLDWDIDNDGKGYRGHKQLYGSPAYADSRGRTRHEVAEVAKSQIGYRETGTNCNKYSKALGYGCQQWCADFTEWVYRQAGGVDVRGATPAADSYRTTYGYADGHPNWRPGSIAKAKPGDAILYDWNGDGRADHVGIIVSNINGKITSVEGNSSNQVSKRTNRQSASNVMGYASLDFK